MAESVAKLGSLMPVNAQGATMQARFGRRASLCLRRLSAARYRRAITTIFCSSESRECWPEFISEGICFILPPLISIIVFATSPRLNRCRGSTTLLGSKSDGLLQDLFSISPIRFPAFSPRIPGKPLVPALDWTQRGCWEPVGEITVAKGGGRFKQSEPAAHLIQQMDRLRFAGKPPVVGFGAGLVGDTGKPVRDDHRGDVGRWRG